MSRMVFLMLCTMVLAKSALAAIVVTSEDNGATSTQVFDQGAFVLLQDGRPAFGIDRQGNCWLIERGQLVSDPCETMLRSMGAMREQAMAGLSAQDKAMMERMMGSMGGGPAVQPVRAGSKTIAGYAAACYSLNSTREYCVSADLLRQVEKEMGGRRYTDMFRQFSESAQKAGAVDPTTKAIAKLSAEGYPMLDMRKSSGIPGMNSAMMQLIPPAQRAELMKQMGGAASGQMQGSKVLSVDPNGRMPTLDLGKLPRIGFAEFMQQNMGQMGAMPKRR